MRNDQHDAVDALIDEAAQAMTRRMPPRSLRVNVRERIARPWRAWSLVPMLAGAAVLLVAVIVGRALLVAPDVRLAIEHTAPPGAREQARPLDAQRVPDVAMRQQRSVQSIRRRSASIAAPSEEPLIPPLTIEPLTVPQIVTVVRGMTPIEIAPLQIEPIPDATDPLPDSNSQLLDALGL